MISALQGLRGLSILLVFFSHWFAGARSGGFLPAQWADGLAVFNLGKYGVELFFMISGFVITKSLIRHNDTISFGIDRIARIYPVFLVIHLLIFITGPLIQYKFFEGVDLLEWRRLFLANALLLPGVFDFPIAQIVAWSLSYEVMFYILAAGFYHCHKNSGQYLKLSAAAIAAVLFLWFHPRSLFFLPGVLAYFTYQSARYRLVWSSSAGAVAFVAFFVAWSPLSPEDGKTLPEITERVTDMLCLVAALGGATLFLFQVLRDEGLLKRVMQSRWLVSLGEISYSFYLLHIVVIFALKRLTVRFVQPETGDELAFMFFGLMAFAMSYWLSSLSRRWLEVRAGEALKTGLSRLRSAHSPMSGSPR